MDVLGDCLLELVSLVFAHSESGGFRLYIFVT